jgi:GT2 family glycosyltransferase
MKLSIAIVIFRPNAEWLHRTWETLTAALKVARESGALSTASIVLVDNGPPGESPWKRALDKEFDDIKAVRAKTIAGHGNVGFGRAVNLAFADCKDDDALLVLNPDVALDADSIRIGLSHLRDHPACAMVTPSARDPDGTPLYLARRKPSIGVLLARGFGSDWLTARYAKQLAAYEYRLADDPPFDGDIADHVVASGCFMLMRSRAFFATNGFDERFFLYFEDYDLSLRLHQSGTLSRVGACRIVHAGGNTANKGLRHTLLFAASAIKFFRKHG